MMFIWFFLLPGFGWVWIQRPLCVPRGWRLFEGLHDGPDGWLGHHGQPRHGQPAGGHHRLRHRRTEKRSAFTSNNFQYGKFLGHLSLFFYRNWSTRPSTSSTWRAWSTTSAAASTLFGTALRSTPRSWFAATTFAAATREGWTRTSQTSWGRSSRRRGLLRWFRTLVRRLRETGKTSDRLLPGWQRSWGPPTRLETSSLKLLSKGGYEVEYWRQNQNCTQSAALYTWGRKRPRNLKSYSTSTYD